MRKKAFVPIALALTLALFLQPASAFNYDLSFWLSRSPRSYDLLADVAKVAEINARIQKSATTGIVDLLEYPQDIDGFSIAGYLALPTLPNELYLADGSAAPTGAITQIMAKYKPESVPAWAKVRFGVAVYKSDLRLLPAADKLFNKRTGGVDVLQAGRLLPGEPCIILTETTDKTWFFIQTARGRGWVASMQIAIAFTREHWLSYADSEEFLIVTSPSLFLEQDLGSLAPSLMELPMGTRLPLVPESAIPDAVKNRGTADSYVVLLPSKRVDGKLNVTPTLIPRTSDVSQGYMALSGENILKQAMKLVGTKYSYKGSSGRDPYLLVSDVFRCMGLEMPLTAAGYDALPFVMQNIKGTSADLKLLALRKAVPGSVIMLDNGPSIYLGQYGEDVYTIAALGDVRMPSKAKNSFELLNIPFNGVSLIALKSVYSETGNDYFTEARYLMEPILK